ncbi:MAG TPA: CBS domain-containing protein [Kofleriaceae bacterium]|nr:CBS domain-containing protein [Kofleriaceae bacterium]
MPSEVAKKRHELPVRTRETIEPGSTATTSTVHCPKRDAAATVKECLLCPNCLELATTEHGQCVICEIDPAEDVSSPPPRRRARRPSESDRTPLSAVMSGSTLCVSPDLPIRELLAVLIDRGFSGAPVVDSTGKAIGVVSRTDLLDDGRDGLVRDIMMPIAFTLPESASLSHAAALMAYENIHRVPVLGIDGSVVGIVTSMDIVRWVAEQDGYVVGRTR